MNRVCVLNVVHTLANFAEYAAKRDAENALLMTDPPTQKITNGCSGTGIITIEYPEDTVVKWVCPCGEDKFLVFYVEGAYRTFVRCPTCGMQDDVHTG